MNNDERRLYAIVLRLAATRKGAIPADHGYQAQSALLDLIRRSDSPLAEQLHNDNSAKPYTISLLEGGKRGADRARHFGEGDTADWRFTLMVEPAFEALLGRYLMSRELPHIRIGAVDFAIVDAFASGASHPESGHVSLGELTERWNRIPESLPTVIGMDFRSPTAFSLGTDKETNQRHWESLPVPRLLFSSLRKRWARMGGAEPSDLFDTWVEENVRLEVVTLERRRVYIKRSPIDGFSGQVNYLVKPELRWLPLLHLLTDLTFWTGVGYQPTQGLGQVRKLTKPAEPKIGAGW